MDFGIIIPTADIVLRIGQAGQSSFAAFEFGGARTSFGDDALIVFVERGKIAADVGEDVGVGGISSLCFDVRIEERFFHPRAVLGGDFAAAFGGGGATSGLIGQPEATDHDVAVEEVLLATGEAAVLGVECVEIFRGGSGLVVVVHEVDLMRAAIRGAIFPVEDDVVADVEATSVFIVGLAQTAGETPIATSAMGEEVVMKAADVAADARGVTVLRADGIFFVPRFVKGFGDQRALERDVVCATRADGFVERPTDGAMINDAIVAGGHAHAVERHAGKIAGADAKVACDDIGCAQHAEVVFAKTDAFAGRSLARDGQIGICLPDDEARFKGDEAGDIEDDGAGAGLLNSVAQTAEAGIVEIGDVQYASAASALSEASVALGRGESEGLVGGFLRLRYIASNGNCDEQESYLTCHVNRTRLIMVYSL